MLCDICKYVCSSRCYVFLPNYPRRPPYNCHYNDVIMGAMASQITSLTIVYLTVYSGGDQRKHKSSASLAFLRGIHRWPVNSPHKGPVTWEMFPFDDVIMCEVGIAIRCLLWVKIMICVLSLPMLCCAYNNAYWTHNGTQLYMVWGEIHVDLLDLPPYTTVNSCMPRMIFSRGHIKADTVSKAGFQGCRMLTR